MHTAPINTTTNSILVHKHNALVYNTFLFCLWYLPLDVDRHNFCHRSAIWMHVSYIYLLVPAFIVGISSFLFWTKHSIGHTFLNFLNSAILFPSIQQFHEGSHNEVYQEFQLSYDIFCRWCQGLFRPQVLCTPSPHCPTANSPTGFMENMWKRISHCHRSDAVWETMIDCQNA